MQITIDLPQDLEQDLLRQAAQSNIPLQTLILQALRQLTQPIPDPVSQLVRDACEVPFLSGKERSFADFPCLCSSRTETILHSTASVLESCRSFWDY